MYYANGRGPDTIEFTDGFYNRKLPGGSSQRFNGLGQLAQMSDRNNNFLKFSYSDGLLKDVIDNNGRKISFSFYPNKKVKSIAGPNNLRAEYKFEKLNDLSYSKDAWNNNYTYKYDELHNLTQIHFPDKTKKTLTYDANKDWVTSFIDRQNCKETYAYELSKDDPQNHYWSTLTKKCGDRVTSTGRFEFWFKLNKDKTDKYLARVLTKNNNDVTDILYHESIGRPISTTVNGRTVRFIYDEGTGLLKTKIEGTRTVNFAYDQKCNKVGLVTEGKNRTNFSYDVKCNLVSANNTRGQTVALTYDLQGRIAMISDQAKRVVKLRYEERFGKPVFVERPGLGSITVAYKPNGEIKDVQSSAGPTVALQVTSTFNNLLDIIEPAGIELGF